MDIQRELVSQIIQKQDITTVLDRKIEPRMFTDEASKQVFDGIMKFYSEYKAIPSIEWVEHEYPDYRVTYAKQPQQYYIDELMKLYTQREVQELLIKQSAGLYHDPFKTVDEIKSRLTKITLESRPTEDIDIRDTIEDRKADYEHRETCGGMDGYSTPWSTLNDATWGIHDGEFWVYAARPAVGKTFELLVLAEHLNRVEGKNLVIITNEMHHRQLNRRYDAVHFRLPYSNFRSGLLTTAQKQAYFRGLDAMKKSNSFVKIIGGQGLGVNSIANKVEQYKPDILLIDGFYLTPDDQKGKDVWSRTTNVSRGLKQLALHYNIPVIGTTQFNRGVGEKSEEAELGNIGFADAIGQDADVVVGLIKTKDMKLNNEIQNSVMKSREGDTPTFRHEFNLDTMSFQDLNEVIKEKFEPEEDEELEF